MKQFRDILGYLLGLVLFVGLMPALMWLASGRPAFWAEVKAKDVLAWGLLPSCPEILVKGYKISR